jgi:hypothetical protein
VQLTCLCISQCCKPFSRAAALDTEHSVCLRMHGSALLQGHTPPRQATVLHVLPWCMASCARAHAPAVMKHYQQVLTCMVQAWAQQQLPGAAGGRAHGAPGSRNRLSNQGDNTTPAGTSWWQLWVRHEGQAARLS